ncbi:sialate O-acetylesterase [Lelliottia sp. WAP21]|uniref:sialate O-acetylesterase n=1 Tax=Lelliottia sp. WAP21 TaxID=2877426 RepID=UPI001E52A4E4
MSFSRRDVFKIAVPAALSLPAVGLAKSHKSNVRGGKLDIIIIYGQSNALGLAGIDDNFKESSLVKINDGSYYYFDGEVKPLTHYLPSVNMGMSSGSPWSQFSNTYKQITGRGCVFIQCARGSTPLADLAPPSMNYKRMVEESNKLISILGKNSIDNIFTVFHQGEADQIANTPKKVYKDMLVSLGLSMQKDIGISKFFVFKVGEPQKRSQESISAIQSAQDEICKEQELFIMAFSGCSSFKRENLLMGSDGVHYSIYGYNLMGQIGAENVASNIETRTTITKDDVGTYGALSLTASYDWRYVAATFGVDGGKMRLLSNIYPEHNEGLYATSHIIDFDISDNIIKATPSFPLSKILSKNVSAECSEPSITLHPVLKVNKAGPVEIRCRFDVSFDVQVGSHGVFRYASGEIIEALRDIVTIESDDSTGYLKVTHPKTSKAPEVYSSGPGKNRRYGDFNIQQVDDKTFIIMPGRQATGSRFCVKISDCEMDLSKSSFDNLLISFDVIAA